MRPDIAYPKAKAAIEKAQSINNDLAEVHAAMGLMRNWLELDWVGSEQSLKQSISIDPDYVLGLCWYSFLLNSLRRHEESLAMAERARDLDPLSPYTTTTVGFSFFRQGRHEEAIPALKTALEMEPDFLYTHWVLGGAYMRNNQHENAIAVFEKAATLSGRSSFYLGWLAWAYGTAGDRDRATGIIKELDERAKTEYVAASFFAWAYAGLDDADQTFVWLDKAVEERGPQLFLMPAIAPFDALYSDPRFNELLKQLGHPDASG
jgi:tetratricopeptide (TPR) repeat protein